MEYSTEGILGAGAGFRRCSSFPDDFGESRIAGRAGVKEETVKVLLAAADLMPAVMLTEWGYEVVTAQNGTEAWQLLLQDDELLLAILDRRMPGLDGVEVCRRIRAAACDPYVYVILLEGGEAEADRETALEAGVDDFLDASLNERDLYVRLRAARRILDLHQRLHTARGLLTKEAIYDPLTGLWNRTAIMDLFWQDLARARRDGTPLAIAIAEPDHIDHIVEIHGRLAGSMVMGAVAERASAQLRIYDRMARLERKRFLFILPGCTAVTGGRIMERIRLQFAARPINISEGLIPITLSAGVTAWEGDRDESQEDLLHRAYDALERAIQTGRNYVEVSEPLVAVLTDLVLQSDLAIPLESIRL